MYRRILSVQDISCLGQCSMTVALPILSACGHETCILPSALLSTHTGGFGPVYKQDLTGAFPGILEHWKRENVTFDGVCIGYLGSISQIDWAKNIFETMVTADGKRIVDPVMADHGKLYSGFDGAYVAQMAKLCARADVILPNVTEACLLTQIPYQEELSEEFVELLLNKLGTICSSVVLTGVGYTPEETGIVVYQKGNLWHYTQKKVPQNYHGTGDIFAATFAGAWMQGKTMEEAAKIAADYTALCIQKTYDAPAHWYGVKFEAALPELMKMMQL